MNVWCFTGNLGNAADTRFLPNGDPVVSFSVAVKAGYGDKATTTWARCSMFGKRGEAVAPYLVKGARVGVSGEASMREWTDKEAQKRQSLEVRVNDLTLLSAKSEQSAPAAAPKTATPASGPFDEMDDDIPFMNPYYGRVCLVV